MHSRFTIALLVLVLAACDAAPGSSGAEGGTDAADAGSPTVDVGTGKDQFQPLADGDPVDLIHGPQGGWHIWGAVRLRGFVHGETSVTYAVALESDPTHPLSSTEYRVTPVRHGSWCEWPGLIGYVPDPAAAGGQRAVLQMTVKDEAGLELTSERHVSVRPMN